MPSEFGLYDAQTTKELDLLTGHTLDVTTVSFSPDGSILASASGGQDYLFVACANGNTGPDVKGTCVSY